MNKIITVSTTTAQRQTAILKNSSPELLRLNVFQRIQKTYGALRGKLPYNPVAWQKQERSDWDQ